MARNPFKNDPLEGLTDLQIADLIKEGKATVNDFRRHRGLPELSGEGERESQNQEAEPVEDSSDDEKTRDQVPSPSDFRREPGSRSRPHIAEMYESEDKPYI